MDPVRAEAIRTLYLQLRTSTAAAGIVTLYMIGTAAAFTPWPVIAGWASVQLATQLLRELLFRLWRRAGPRDAALDRWAAAYSGYMALAGLVWGATIFLFAHPAQPITVALTLCGLYGISSGSVPANAYNPPGLRAFVGLIFAAVLIRCLATGRFDYALLGAASAGFALIMIGFGRVQTRTILDGIRIRFKNQALLAEVTEQKAQAEEARRKAELASLAKSQFLAAASHDLRQPLYALGLFSASLDELRLDAEGRAVVANIHRSVAALESLFDGLLDISKLEAGVVRAAFAPVSLDALFDRLSQYHRPIAVARGLDLRFRSDGVWIWSDAALIEQVLSNLLANALHYTSRGAVLAAARMRGDQVRIEVWDLGIGIAAGDLRRIFDEFVQLGNAERDRSKGLGLGLSIARRAAALLGAEIEVTSRLGRGSRFVVAQRRVRGPVAAEVPPSPPRALPPRRDLPVLVVEDDREVRLAIAGLLARWQVPSVLAAHGADALARIAAGDRFSLLLADHWLPEDIRGIDIIAAARALDPLLPVALITADFDPRLVATAAERGVPLLHKPVAAATLRALLHG